MSTAMKEYNVSWQSGTMKGTLTYWALDGQQAYILASPALAVISKEHNLLYMNVTVAEKEKS